MKYWIVEKNATDFSLVKSESEPNVRQITKAEYDHYKKWIKDNCQKI